MEEQKKAEATKAEREKMACKSFKHLLKQSAFSSFAKEKKQDTLASEKSNAIAQASPAPTSNAKDSHSITQASPLLSFKPNDILAGSGFCIGCKWYASQPGFGEDQGKLVEWCQRAVKDDETTGGGVGQVAWIFKRIRENVRVRQCPRIGEAW
jgi:hypothetical protein